MCDKLSCGFCVKLGIHEITKQALKDLEGFGMTNEKL